MSSLIVAKSGNRTGPGGPSGSSALGPGSGVPLVRATSPGAEIREEKRLAAQRKEKEERIRKAVYESPSKPVPAASPSPSPSPVATRESKESREPASDRSSPTVSSPGKPIRRFQISRTSATTPMNLHRSFDGGVQKRKGAGGADGVAVLVEKLRRRHSRQASVALQGATGVNLDGAAPGTTGDAAGSGTDEPRPRKRPVVNQAERKWREERKNAISAAKENISSAMDRGAQARHKDSNWDDESDKLVGEFERIALELDGPSPAQTQIQTQPRTEMQAETQTESKPTQSKPLKYQPRTPSKPRNDPATATATATKPERTEGVEDTEDSEDDYVYDVYVRRPLTQAQAHAESQAQLQPPSQPQFQSQSLPTNLKNPLAELENQNALLSANVGVIVITQEDEIYWESFIEDEEDDEWDSEDADSNGTLPPV